MRATNRFDEAQLFGFTVVGILLMLLPTLAAEQLLNSTLACTRGSDQTYHNLRCGDTMPKGTIGSLFIRRVFYGTVPTTSGCDRVAPYSSCCTRNSSNVDCVFEDMSEITDLVKRFTGVNDASFLGTRLSTEGNCDPNMYPNLTSFSFVEFGCVSSGLLTNIWSSKTQLQEGEVYLDSNIMNNNSKIRDSVAQCLVQTDCNETLTFNALYLKLKVANYTPCPEDVIFSDFKYPDTNTTAPCADSALIFNKELFTSKSNVALLTLSVTGNHTGKIFIKVNSSSETTNVKLVCGADINEAMKHIQQCPGELYTPSSSDLSTASSSEPATVIPITESTEMMHPGTIAGIVLAIIAIILVVILIIGIILYRHRKNRNSQSYYETETIVSSSDGTYKRSQTGSHVANTVSSLEDIYDDLSSAHSQGGDYQDILDVIPSSDRGHTGNMNYALGFDNSAYKV